ncbi:zinc finger CCCH domain-containing protein 14-like [Sycon ciliatum]|uniref:zinc finger CCCH domain-containing protein 14-like n=1 Tax=Sycon ciliatum TaxID=27933 RepID=UPI0031F69ADA
MDAEKLHRLVSNKLKSINCFIDEELPEYILTMVENEKPPSAMVNDLSLFLAEHSQSFVDWLQQQVSKEDGKRKSVNEARGSGSSSKKHKPPTSPAAANSKSKATLAVQAKGALVRSAASPSSVGVVTPSSVVSVVSRKHVSAQPARSSAEKPVAKSTTSTAAASKRGTGPTSALRLLTRAMDGANKDSEKALSEPKEIPAISKDESQSSGNAVEKSVLTLTTRKHRQKQVIAAEKSHTSPAETHSAHGSANPVQFKVTMSGKQHVANNNGQGTSQHTRNSAIVIEDKPAASVPRKTQFVVTLNGKKQPQPSDLPQPSPAAALVVTVNQDSLKQSSNSTGATGLKCTVPTNQSAAADMHLAHASGRGAVSAGSSSSGNYDMVITVPVLRKQAKPPSISRGSDATTPLLVRAEAQQPVVNVQDSPSDSPSNYSISSSRSSSSLGSSYSSDGSSGSSSSGSSYTSSDSDGGMSLSLDSDDDADHAGSNSRVPAKKSAPIAVKKVTAQTGVKSVASSTKPKPSSRPLSVVIAPQKRPAAPTSGAPPGKKSVSHTSGKSDGTGALVVKCRSFPNCPYGRACSFVHPDCPAASQCHDKSCPYNHTVANPRPTAATCKYGVNCSRLDCPYTHPTSDMCRFGINCTRRTCTFRHPSSNRAWVKA